MRNRVLEEDVEDKKKKKQPGQCVITNAKRRDSFNKKIMICNNLEKKGKYA